MTRYEFKVWMEEEFFNKYSDIPEEVMEVWAKVVKDYKKPGTPTKKGSCALTILNELGAIDEKHSVTIEDIKEEFPIHGRSFASAVRTLRANGYVGGAKTSSERYIKEIEDADGNIHEIPSERPGQVTYCLTAKGVEYFNEMKEEDKVLDLFCEVENVENSEETE